MQKSCFPRKSSERSDFILHTLRTLDKYLFNTIPTYCTGKQYIPCLILRYILLYTFQLK